MTVEPFKALSGICCEQAITPYSCQRLPDFLSGKRSWHGSRLRDRGKPGNVGKEQ
jgi:hypothetical protein